MRIRSITVFVPLLWPFDEGSIASVGHFLADARQSFNRAGFEVQTVRLATPPFLDVVGDPDPAVLIEFSKTLEETSRKHQIDAVSIGPVVAATPLALLMSIHALPQLMVETEIISSGVLFAAENTGINLAAARGFAEVILQVAHSTPNGSGNLRLAALANVPPHVPFFPAAYHHGGFPCFAVATEAADLAVQAIGQARSLQDAQQSLTEAIKSTAVQLLKIADLLVDDHQIEFKGIDFSLAPYPTQSQSIGAGIESLGIDAFGGSGTLYAVSFLANCIRQAEIPQVGFSGVMLPLLEDKVLADRAADGLYTVNDLLLYSAVCGTGLDTVPIPGNTSPDEIAAIFLDMAALAVSTGKPLTARLLPIPGKAVGQKITFDSEYYTGGRVLPVKNMGTHRLFQAGSFLKITPRKTRQKSNLSGYPFFPGPKPKRLP